MYYSAVTMYNTKTTKVVETKSSYTEKAFTVFVSIQVFSLTLFPSPSSSMSLTLWTSIYQRQVLPLFLDFFLKSLFVFWIIFFLYFGAFCLSKFSLGKWLIHCPSHSRSFLLSVEVFSTHLKKVLICSGSSYCIREQKQERNLHEIL